MTEEQFRNKVSELYNNLPELLEKNINSFLVSGTEDLDDYENDFELPKIFMAAFGMSITFQHKPLHNTINDNGNNIKNIYKSI